MTTTARYTFTPQHGRPIRVYVGRPAGDVIDLPMEATSFSLQRSGLSEDIVAPIAPTKLRFTSVYRGGSGPEFGRYLAFETALLGAADREIPVVAREQTAAGGDGEVLFTGFVLPEGAIDPDRQAPRRIRIEATDGLGYAKTTPYEPAGGGVFEGVDSLAGHLSRALQLSEIGCASPYFQSGGWPVFPGAFKASIRWREARMSAGANVLQSTRIAHRAFWTVDRDGIPRAVSCYEVVEQIALAFAATFTQQTGGWTLVQPGAIAGEGYRLEVYLPGGGSPGAGTRKPIVPQLTPTASPTAGRLAISAHRRDGFYRTLPAVREVVVDAISRDPGPLVPGGLTLSGAFADDTDAPLRTPSSVELFNANQFPDTATGELSFTYTALATVVSENPASVSAELVVTLGTDLLRYRRSREGQPRGYLPLGEGGEIVFALPPYFLEASGQEGSGVRTQQSTISRRFKLPLSALRGSGEVKLRFAVRDLEYRGQSTQGSPNSTYEWTVSEVDLTYGLPEENPASARVDTGAKSSLSVEREVVIADDPSYVSRHRLQVRTAGGEWVNSAARWKPLAISPASEERRLQELVANEIATLRGQPERVFEGVWFGGGVRADSIIELAGGGYRAMTEGEYGLREGGLRGVWREVPGPPPPIYGYPSAPSRPIKGINAAQTIRPSRDLISDVVGDVGVVLGGASPTPPPSGRFATTVAGLKSSTPVGTSLVVDSRSGGRVAAETISAVRADGSADIASASPLPPGAVVTPAPVTASEVVAISSATVPRYLALAGSEGQRTVVLPSPAAEEGPVTVHVNGLSFDAIPGSPADGEYTYSGAVVALGSPLADGDEVSVRYGARPRQRRVARRVYPAAASGAVSVAPDEPIGGAVAARVNGVLAQGAKATGSVVDLGGATAEPGDLVTVSYWAPADVGPAAEERVDDFGSLRLPAVVTLAAEPVGSLPIAVVVDGVATDVVGGSRGGFATLAGDRLDIAYDPGSAPARLTVHYYAPA